ncbi:MAG: YiiD C-terminal domain-containing protein [Candidatus Pelagadaptatus aseana]|uniref:PaaI family thioesterase n=1 Tax=Candidatus Pelagadaptatus aseana TaxID=3120508 RepID=UPI0039B3471C
MSNESYGVSIINGIDAISRTGLSFDSVAANSLTARMPLAGNSNHTGIMYAGSLFALAECAAGVLFMNRYDANVIAPICASVNIRFRRPAGSDITLTMNISDEQFEQLQNDVLANGKAAVEFEEKLQDSNGEVVAIADVKYVLLKV